MKCSSLQVFNSFSMRHHQDSMSSTQRTTSNDINVALKDFGCMSWLYIISSTTKIRRRM